MSRIGIVDLDNMNFPNLALMKITSFHRMIGDNVYWATPLFKKYEKVYISKVFSHKKTQIYNYNTNKLIFGGTGFDLNSKLPPEIEAMQPDYSIYNYIPNNRAYGFLTRGCCNNCYFCVVPKKEGVLKINNDVTDIAINGRKELILMDNNILGLKDYALEQFEKIIINKYTVDFNQGLEAKLVDVTIAKMLSKIQFINNTVRFACDNENSINSVVNAINLLINEGYNGRFLIYTLITNDFKECLNRVLFFYEFNKKIKNRIKLHAQPLLYISGKNEVQQWQKDLCRWANVYQLYNSTHLFEYNCRKNFKFKQYFK